jgi:phosphoribosylformimino-5-aminoimidazole carboxamide ribotide isomerase
VSLAVTSEREHQPFVVIPSLDLLRGRVVRLTRGDFSTVVDYGTPEEVIERWEVTPGRRLHLVDLEGSRRGVSMEREGVERLIRRGYDVQIGGGIRSAADARSWLDAGASRIVVGTAAAESPEKFAAIVAAAGADRTIAAVDLKDGVVRISGWEATARTSLEQLIGLLEELGVGEMLVTDISVDGTLRGPSFALYRELASRTSIRIIASGGVGISSDVRSLARIDGLSGVVIGKALHEQRLTIASADFEAMRRSLPARLIPCLDVRGGRVVKGVRFENLRDAGDPVECAVRYEAEGADELVMLDVSATTEERQASLDTVRKVSEKLFIPLTVGGGVRSVDDFRALLRAGADRVAINSAAVARPALITECAREFGIQAVVVACDAMAAESDNEGAAEDRSFQPRSYRLSVRSGTTPLDLDAVAWCMRAEKLGAGEILLTSIDRDGTSAGFDLQLLRAVTATLRIGVIASGGAGSLEHFAEAIECGGARAVLAATLFHDRKLEVKQVKRFLESRNIEVRR